jgi:hypothetical protein
MSESARSPGRNLRQLTPQARFQILSAGVSSYIGVTNPTTTVVTIHGPEQCTPEEFARDYNVPIEAVREALDYVENNMELIQAERREEADDMRARGLDCPSRQ